MPRLRRHAGPSASFLICALVVLLPAPALAQPAFHSIGTLGGTLPMSQGDGISADGGTAVGYSGSNSSFNQAIRWTLNGGIQGLGVPPNQPPGPTFGVATGASDGGQWIACYNQNTSRYAGYRWNAATGFQDLGDLPGGSNSTIAEAISRDGSVVAGIGNYNGGNGDRGFIWRQSTGIQPLPKALNGNTSQGLGISADGRFVVGDANTTVNGRTAAVRWHDGVVDQLGDLPGGLVSGTAMAVSPDGRFVVGASSSTASGNNSLGAFLWVEGQGMTPLGDLPGDIYRSIATGVSDDGRLVVGYSNSAAPTVVHEEAFIWDAQHGMRALRTVLQNDLGLNMTGIQLDRATGISADGTVISGFAENSLGFTFGFVAVIPGPGVLPTVGLVVSLGGMRPRRAR